MHFFQMNSLCIPVSVGIYLGLASSYTRFHFLCSVTRVAWSNISLISTGSTVLILATDHAPLDFRMRFIRNIKYIQNPINLLSSPTLAGPRNTSLPPSLHLACCPLFCCSIYHAMFCLLCVRDCGPSNLKFRTIGIFDLVVFSFLFI